MVVWRWGWWGGVVQLVVSTCKLTSSLLRPKLAWLCILCLYKSILEFALGPGIVSAFCPPNSVTCSGREEVSLCNLPAQELEMSLHLHKCTPCATNSSLELRGVRCLFPQAYHVWVHRCSCVWWPGFENQPLGPRQINELSSSLSVFNDENSPSACLSPYSHYNVTA